MKKIILAAAAIVSAAGFSAASVAAEDGGKADLLLGELAKKVAGWGDYRVEFRVTVGDQAMEGKYEVSGEKYHVATTDIEMYCDGATKWEVNKLDREVAIDRVDTEDRTVMGNPTKLFDFLDGSYERRYVGPAIIGGVACERIELKEKAAGSGGLSSGGVGGGEGRAIDVFLAAETGLPVRIGYTIGAMSTQATVDVARITPRITIDRNAFEYNKKSYEGYETIDFR